MEKDITIQQIEEASKEYAYSQTGFIHEKQEGFIEGAKWAKKMLKPRMMFKGRFVDEMNDQEKKEFDQYVINNLDSLLRPK